MTRLLSCPVAMPAGTGQNPAEGPPPAASITYGALPSPAPPFPSRIPGRVGYFGPFPADQPITFEPEVRSGAAAARRAVRAVQLDASADMVAAEAARGRGVGGKAYERGWPEFETGEL